MRFRSEEGERKLFAKPVAAGMAATLLAIAPVASEAYADLCNCYTYNGNACSLQNGAYVGSLGIVDDTTHQSASYKFSGQTLSQCEYLMEQAKNEIWKHFHCTSTPNC